MLYTRRQTLAALVCDFPADETLVNGLKGMQGYFTTHGNTVEIPVLKVMNAAHDMIARMFNTLDFPMIRCDAIAYEQMSGNPQLTAITLIVLAEMLARTDGCKARACRTALLEQRSDDFFEGISLYEQFLDAGDAHFAEEDFLIDLMDNINILRAENERLKQELKRQKQTTMPTQPQTVIHVAGNYIAQQNIDIHDNTNCNIYACPQPETQPSTAAPTPEPAHEPSPDDTFFCCITQEAIRTGKAQQVENELSGAAKSTAPKLIAALRTNEALGYVDTKNLSSAELYAMLNRHFGLKYSQRQFTRARNQM